MKTCRMKIGLTSVSQQEPRHHLRHRNKMFLQKQATTEEKQERCISSPTISAANVRVLQPSTGTGGQRRGCLPPLARDAAACPCPPLGCTRRSSCCPRDPIPAVPRFLPGTRPKGISNRLCLAPSSNVHRILLYRGFPAQSGLLEPAEGLQPAVRSAWYESSAL